MKTVNEKIEYLENKIEMLNFELVKAKDIYDTKSLQLRNFRDQLLRLQDHKLAEFDIDNNRHCPYCGKDDVMFDTTDEADIVSFSCENCCEEWFPDDIEFAKSNITSK